MLSRWLPLVIPNGLVSIRCTFKPDTETTDTSKEFYYFNFVLSHIINTQSISICQQYRNLSAR